MNVIRDILPLLRYYKDANVANESTFEITWKSNQQCTLTRHVHFLIVLLGAIDN